MLVNKEGFCLVKMIEAYILTLKEQKAFTDYLINSSIYNEQYKNIFLIQMYLGLRIGETLALAKDDFDEDYSIVHIRKTLTEDLDGNIIIKNSKKLISKSLCNY